MEREIEIFHPANSYSHVAKVHYWYVDESEGDERPDYRLDVEIVAVNVSEEDGVSTRDVEPEPWMRRAALRELESELDMELSVASEDRDVVIF
jgi:hypothetical protein